MASGIHTTTCTWAHVLSCALLDTGSPVSNRCEYGDLGLGAMQEARDVSAASLALSAQYSSRMSQLIYLITVQDAHAVRSHEKARAAAASGWAAREITPIKVCLQADFQVHLSQERCWAPLRDAPAALPFQLRDPTRPPAHAKRCGATHRSSPRWWIKTRRQLSSMPTSCAP